MYRGGFIFALVVGFICLINTVIKKGECYFYSIPRKEATKRNALLNLSLAYQIYHGFKKKSVKGTVLLTLFNVHTINYNFRITSIPFFSICFNKQSETSQGTFRLSYFKNIYLPYCIATSG